MTNIELIKQLLSRLKKFSWLIVIIAAGFGAGFYYMAKQAVVVYTSKSTVFPLNSSSDNSVSGSAISSLLGLSDAPKSFSGEASINIVELATSRRTREAVASAKVPVMGNKTIAALLIEEHNRHLGFMQNTEIRMPKDSLALVNIGSSILGGAFVAKINKNGILELYFSNSNTQLVREVSYVFINKISDFYIDLKKKKAQIDYEFAVKKADSLFNILTAIDGGLVKLDETTYFTNDELKRFSIPKTNLIQDKNTVQSQYYYAVNNRESAAYKLQKETPIIEALDKPEGPYDGTEKSTKLYVMIGLFLGAFLGALIVSWKLISNYLGDELNKAVEKASKPKETTPVTPAVPAP